jgi:hypothetical protein
MSELLTWREDDEALSVLTSWACADQDPACAESNAVKDALYAAYIKRLVGSLAPWLLPLLSASGAWVAAGPGRLFVVLPTGEYFPLPVLTVYTNLLPWVEPGEVAH